LQQKDGSTTKHTNLVGDLAGDHVANKSYYCSKIDLVGDNIGDLTGDLTGDLAGPRGRPRRKKLCDVAKSDFTRYLVAKLCAIIAKS
jgi:hypothetical protein